MERCGGRNGNLKVWAIAAIGAVVFVAGGTLASPSAGAASQPGYWLGADDGGVFAYGAPFFRSEAAITGDDECLQGCAVASWPFGHGYWVLTTTRESQGSQGGPIAAGFSSPTSAVFAPLCLAGQCVDTPASAARPWRVTGVPGLQYGVLGLTADGAVYSVSGPNPSEYAQTYGSMAGRGFAGTMVGITSTPDGKGYWMVASDGGVFAFGDAQFEGSMGGKPLNSPVVAIASTPDGKGYWLVGADGGVFAFGDADFRGSMSGIPLNDPVVGIAEDGTDSGYWLAASDGGVFAFGSAPFRGSLSGAKLNAPITSIATSS